MTDAPNPNKPANADRIAKVIARAGLASRRDAERLIIAGRVTVNGQKISSPALDVLPSDKIVVDGKPLDAPQETRLWLYYKPVGLVSTDSDEKGRQTIFDALPRDLPRVMSVGRLDLNSEGLLLLTNDGELKRRLELPATGWLRRYRVRVNGSPTDLTFDPLRRGVTIDGEEFQPMEVRLDSQQGANAWLTVGIREGRNREIRRAMLHVGLQVNRLIRIGYGPFKLTGLEENEVREVKRRTMRDQLGGLLTGEVEDKPREFRDRGADEPRERRPRRDEGERRPFKRHEDKDRTSFGKEGDARGTRGGDADRKPRFARKGDDERKPFRRRDDDAGPRRDGGSEDGRKPRWSKPGPKRNRPDGEAGKPHGDKPFRSREGGKPAPRREGDKPFNRRDGDKPFQRREGGKPGGPRKDGGKPGFKGRSGSGPKGPRSGGDKPRGPRG